MNFNKREEQFMNIGTAANAVFHMRQVEEKELKREKIASWYITVQGIPAQEKEKLEKSLKYNVWSSLIRLWYCTLFSPASGSLESGDMILLRA